MNSRPAHTPTTNCREIYRIQVLERAFGVPDVPAEASTELALTELSRRLRLHRSTVHRLVMVLESTPYLARNPVTGRYHLGSKLLELETRAAAMLDVPAVARPFLERLVAETGETAHVGVLHQRDVVSITNADATPEIARRAYRITGDLVQSRGAMPRNTIPREENCR